MSMREMSARSGVGEATLRMWELRHGFPKPQRRSSGHRRYSELDLARVRAVVRARESGLSLQAAIDLASDQGQAQPPSVYAALRERFPALEPQLLPKRAMLAMSRAIEDECLARAERPVLFGCFQRERFYRQSEGRWRELARTAERAVVLADFPRLRRPRHAPVEVPIRAREPVAREWAVVCESPELRGLPHGLGAARTGARGASVRDDVDGRGAGRAPGCAGVLAARHRGGLRLARRPPRAALRRAGGARARAPFGRPAQHADGPVCDCVIARRRRSPPRPTTPRSSARAPGGRHPSREPHRGGSESGETGGRARTIRSARSGSGAPPSHTIVSAPCSGVRMIGPRDRAEHRHPRRTPSVSTHPGCIAWTTTPRSRSRSASSSVITTCSRLVRA